MSTLEAPRGEREPAAMPVEPGVKALLDELPVPLLALDEDGRIVWSNRAAERLSGRPLSAVRRLRWDEDLLVTMEGARPFLRHREGYLSPVRVQRLGPRRALLGEGSELLCVTDATPSLSILEYARRFPELDLTDPLTQVGNRRLAGLEVESHLIRYQLHRQDFGAVLFDVDMVHCVNERLGYDCSDRALAGVARTLCGCLEEHDTLCRWGGDQYLALVVGDAATVEGRAELCRCAVEQARLEWGDESVALTVSAGIEMATPGAHPGGPGGAGGVPAPHEQEARAEPDHIQPFGSRGVEGAGGFYAACLGGEAFGAERGFHSVEQQEDVFLTRAGAHDADPEDFAGEGSKAAEDFDAVAVHEALADGHVGDAFGDAGGVQRPEALAGGDEHAEAHRFEAGDEGFVIALVAGKARREPFFADDLEGFAHGVEHRDGRGVVVAVGGAVVFVEEFEVEIPALV
ncbi:MAG: diguanylate cyclase [Bryobacterales bacterium]|nr:diguanylate cyclase [Bryobacterales bacterium]